jgi:hypothetical protein
MSKQLMQKETKQRKKAKKKHVIEVLFTGE